MKNSGFVFILLIICLFSCSSNKSSDKKIGFLIRSFTLDRCVRERDFFLERAKTLGADVVVADAQNDDKKQLDQAIEMMNQGVKVLVIFAVNSVTSAAIVREANKNNIPVVAYEIIIQNCDLDYYITADNEKGGKLMAEYIIKNYPQGNYVLIGGDKADHNAELIMAGQVKVLEPFIKQKKINVLFQNFTDWTAAEGYYYTNRIINLSSIVPDVIVASNDGIASGVIKALEERNLAGKVAVTGLDAELSALQRIAAGSQTLTIFKSFKKQAYAAAELAVSLAEGKKPENINSKSFNNKIDVPTFLIDPELVTKDNLKEIIKKDGIFKESDVFK